MSKPDPRQLDAFALFDAPPPPDPVPTVEELERTHQPAFFGCFATEAAAELDAARYRKVDGHPYTVEAAPNQWNVYRWHPKPEQQKEAK